MAKLFKKQLEVTLCLSLAVTSPVFAAQHYSRDIENIVIFGDSLSDVGNVQYLLQTLNGQQSNQYLISPIKKYMHSNIEDTIHGIFGDGMIANKAINKVNDLVDGFLESASETLQFIFGSTKAVPILPAKPYYSGHFSNGCVWNEFLADAYSIKRTNENGEYIINSQEKLPYMNRSFGGSWSVTNDKRFKVQIKEAWRRYKKLPYIRHPIDSMNKLIGWVSAAFVDLISGKFIPPAYKYIENAYFIDFKDNLHAVSDTLFFSWYGGNDYLNFYKFFGAELPEEQDSYVNNVVSNIESNITRLLNEHHNDPSLRLVVFNMPDMSVTPRFKTGALMCRASLLKAVIDKHNLKLTEMVDRFHQKGFTNIRLFDAKGAFDRILVENDVTHHFAEVDYPYLEFDLDETDQCATLSQNAPSLDLGKSRDNSQKFAHNPDLNYVQNVITSFNKDKQNNKLDDEDSYAFWDSVHPSREMHRILAEKIVQFVQDEGLSNQAVLMTADASSCHPTEKVIF